MTTLQRAQLQEQKHKVRHSLQGMQRLRFHNFVIFIIVICNCKGGSGASPKRILFVLWFCEFLPYDGQGTRPKHVVDNKYEREYGVVFLSVKSEVVFSCSCWREVGADSVGQ